jgi:hypothetical protein
MAVAVAMAGELRTLPFLVTNLQTAVLEPLRADLYMDVAMESYCGLARIGVFRYNCGVDAASWSSLVRHLRPIHAHVSGGEPGNRSSFNGLFTRFRRLHDAIAKHERRVSARYEWIIRARPDLRYTCRLSPELLAQSRGRSLLKYDLLAILPRIPAEAALTLGSRHVNCRCEQVVESCVPSVLHSHGHAFASAVSHFGSMGHIQVDHCSMGTRVVTMEGRDLCDAPQLVAIILRNGSTATASGAAPPRPLPSCTARSFQPPEAPTQYDIARCKGAPLAIAGRFGLRHRGRFPGFQGRARRRMQAGPQ